MQGLATLGDRGQAVICQLAGVKIVVYILFKLSHKVFIRIASGEELPIIISVAVF